MARPGTRWRLFTVRDRYHPREAVPRDRAVAAQQFKLVEHQFVDDLRSARIIRIAFSNNRFSFFDFH